MSVSEAIRRAEVLLPGEPAPDGEIDPRWQAIIAIGEYIETEPEAVWRFVQKWGLHPQEDLRMAVATCLLEHLLGQHFQAFFPRVRDLALAHPLFAQTVLYCWTCGQAEHPANAKKLDSLKRRLM
jgi:hypothetical protein